ncbi:DUF4861 domain-containing protein [Fulvivirgaceae bacterium BMA12]|uniref:DUF4861 domain-containing protein n=1 Tax=Agaribacillus aureus TaxID=3051825 RepID=A0ABT8L8R4_9BACT|nr:DUF4861 domain-containing protein [Fulvivirgaceae bacterium BMA12]
MRNINNLLRFLTIPFAVSFITVGCGPKNSFELINSSDLSLEDHPVIVDRQSFKDVRGLPVVRGEDNKIIPTQLEDVDQDGDWDQLIFQSSFGPGEKKVLRYDWVDRDQYPAFASRTQVYLGHSPERNNVFNPVKSHIRPQDHIAESQPYLYQYEGPGWESELVAFRNYFDSRNGKDIFGKAKPKLYVDSIGLGEDYHALHDWGMDILKVGTSLGAGALAMLKNDSLYRLTGTGKASFTIISNGPVRSVFELRYKDWKVNGSSYELVETITIWGGKRWYESHVQLLGGHPEDTVVTGIVNLKKVPSTMLESAGWQVLYSHGKQSENNDMLGMSLLIPNEHFAGFDKAPADGNGVTNTYTAYLKPQDGAYKFIFYAGWQGEDPGFLDKNFFEKKLMTETAQLSRTIVLNFNK